MVIENEFELKQVVYLKTDKDQSPRIVTGVEVCPEGDILYRLVSGTTGSQHCPFEISAEKDVLISTTD